MSMFGERRLPLQRSDFSVVDREFSSIRERFEQEMKTMEEEMARFRSQLMDREQTFFGSSTEAAKKPEAPSNTTTTHRSEVRTWLDGLHSPLIQEGDDGKRLRLRFDVSQYQPEEIVVKTVDNKLMFSDQFVDMNNEAHELIV